MQAAINTRPPKRVHTERRTADGGALAADGRCDGGMAADGQGEAMAMADGRRGGGRDSPWLLLVRICIMSTHLGYYCLLGFV